MMVLNGRMTDKEWWERYRYDGPQRDSVMTYEDLYQMFKKRMMKELEIQIVNSHAKGEIIPKEEPVDVMVTSMDGE